MTNSKIFTMPGYEQEIFRVTEGVLSYSLDHGLIWFRVPPFGEVNDLVWFSDEQGGGGMRSHFAEARDSYLDFAESIDPVVEDKIKVILSEDYVLLSKDLRQAITEVWDTSDGLIFGDTNEIKRQHSRMLAVLANVQHAIEAAESRQRDQND